MKRNTKKIYFEFYDKKRTFGTVCNEIWSSAEKIHNIMSRDSLQFPDFLVSKTRKISSSKFSNLFSLSCLDDGIGRNLVTQTSLFLVCYWARWRAARHELWGFSDALATLHSLEKFDPYPIFWFSWKNAPNCATFVSPFLHASYILPFHLLIKTISARTFHVSETSRNWKIQE